MKRPVVVIMSATVVTMLYGDMQHHIEPRSHFSASGASITVHQNGNDGGVGGGGYGDGQNNAV